MCNQGLKKANSTATCSRIAIITHVYGISRWRQEQKQCQVWRVTDEVPPSFKGRLCPAIFPARLSPSLFLTQINLLRLSVSIATAFHCGLFLSFFPFGAVLRFSHTATHLQRPTPTPPHRHIACRLRYEYFKAVT